MHWAAPAEKDTATAGQFRGNSGLKAQEYSGPILGLVFLRFADARFSARRAELKKASAGFLSRNGRSTQALVRQIQILRNTRDLLPRLLSGQIDFEAMT